MAAADNIMFSRSSGAGSKHAMSSTLKFLVSSSRETGDGGYYDSGGAGLKDTVNFLRVQELFLVIMSVCSSSEGDDVVSLTGPDSESVERARCYIMAMCCPQAYSDIPCNAKLTSLLFDKQDCTLRASLEKDYYVFLRHLHSPSSSSSSDNHADSRTTNDLARVQGREEDVFVAVSKIQNMMTEEGQLYPTVSPYPPMPSKAVPLDCSGSSYFDGKMENAKLLEVFGNLSMEDRQDLVRSYHGKTNRNPPIMTYDSSQPSHVQNLQKKIDYFVQLDFPQDKVRSILESLGPAASDNEVMNRLMKGAPAVHPVNKASGAYHYRGNITGDGSGSQSSMSDHQQPVQQQKAAVDPSKLRHVVIDGSNVAMKHGNGQVFSCRGIEIAVDYFKDRGHDKITVFVPQWRKENSSPESPITDQHVFEKLEREKHLVYTPSRKLNNGRRIICYDDRYIVRLAHKEGGVIVSNDQFRDLMQENPDWKKVIEQRLLQFAFASDFFMPPDDPLGKLGPTLDQFLSKDLRDMEGVSNNILSEGLRPSKPICPHLGNCTFGKKCRYYHPDRESQSSPTLQHQQQQQLTHHQKQDQKAGNGSSGGHRVPTTSSRTPTTSPSPDTHAHRSAAYSMVKSDPRGHFSNQGSSDGTYRERSFSGRAMGARAGLDRVAPTASSVKFSELGETSLHHGIPSIRLNDSLERKMLGHQPTGWVGSSLVLSDGGDVHAERARRPHNHTFPLTQLPHHEVRRENVTGDHSYLMNQGASLVGQGHSHISQDAPLTSSSHFSEHLSHHQQQHHHRYHRSQLHERGVPENVTNTQFPRDTQQSQYRGQSSSGPSSYSQYTPTPHHSHLTHLPLSSHQPQGSYDFPTDPSGLRQDHYQRSPSTQLPSPSSLISYGNVAGNIYPSGQHANVVSPRLGYGTSHGSGSVSINQSTLPLQNTNHHHLTHSQPPPPLHTGYHGPQQGYGQAKPTSLSHAGPAHPPVCRTEVQYSGSRQALYQAAVAVLPGSEYRVKYVMDRHAELSSERDVGTLLDFVQRMD